MTSLSSNLSDDDRLLDLLRLIVTRHPGTTTAINEAFRKAPHLANSYMTFNFRENGSFSEHECRCHYEHEYMTYINETGFDFETFSRVAKNVLKGHCRHAQGGSASPSRTCFNLTSRKSEQNLRRYSVDFDLTNNNLKSDKRLVTRRSSSSLRSLELTDNNRGLTGLHSRRSTSNLRALAEEVEEIKGQTQTSLMHAAAAIGDANLLIFLMKKAKVSLEQVGKFQLSPLHIAILKNKMCYLRNLILRPETYLSNRSGVFQYAVIGPDYHGHKGRLITNKLSLLGLCVKLDDLDTMQDLLNTGLMSDVALERALGEAVEEDHVDATEILLQSGARPDFDVMKTGTSKSVGVFESVFRRFRKDFKIYSMQHPDHITRELIMPSILTRNYDVLQVLLQNGAPLSSKGFYTPLTCAVLENQPEIVQLLMEYNVEKCAEMQGYNLVDIATCMGFTECTDVLRRFGMKRKNRSIKSPVPCNLLLGIASKLELPLDQLKLHRHLEIKHHSHDEDTVLHMAVKTKLSPRIVREILKTGSDVNAKNKKHETPLMTAISKDVCADTEIVRELLYFNPILEQCDKSGKTTLMLAMARDHVVRNLNTKYNSLEGVSDSMSTLLLDCGYNVKFDDVKKPHHTMFALKAVWKDLAATIGCGRDGMYVQHNPKSLKVRSREIVRRSYPGIRLHKLLDYSKVPTEVSDFILMAELLKIDKDV